MFCVQTKGKASAAARVKADEQAKREAYDAGRSRMKREKEEHAARGLAPAPCRDFRLPQRHVPALLMIWELTQVCWAVVGAGNGGDVGRAGWLGGVDVGPIVEAMLGRHGKLCLAIVGVYWTVVGVCAG